MPAPRLAEGLFVDASQGPGFAAAKYGVQCLHQNAMVFSYELESLLRADHDMSLHGYPVCELGLFKFSQKLLFQLAGDSYFVPNCASLEAAVFLNRFAPWWRKLERCVHRMPQSSNTTSENDEEEVSAKRIRRSPPNAV